MDGQSRPEHSPVSGSSEPLNLVVLLGGPSDEREVSLESGQAVAEALRLRGHQVRCVDPAMVDLGAFDWQDVACAFIALHGRFGEDGQVQMLLGELGVAHTGCGPEASRLAMDKRAAKAVFYERGVPTPAWQCFDRSLSFGAVRDRADTLGYPMVVKPAANGSSLGVSIVARPSELNVALEECFEFERHGLMEQCIRGRELTVGILDDRPLPVIELVTERRFYDYQAKYVGGTRYLMELGLTDELYQAVQYMALDAFRSLGCRSFGRVDLMLDGRGRPWVLEVNTIPGFTSHSLLPKAAAHAGLPFDRLCERIVQLALVPQQV